MKRAKPYIFWTLIVANLLVAASLLVKVGLDKPAVAQQAAYRPADYLMIPGDVAGQPTGIVYIVDTTNGRLGAMAYDEATRSIARMQPVDLNRVFSAAR